MLTQAQIIRRQQFEQYYDKQKDKRDKEKQRRVEIKTNTKDPKELQLYIQKEFKDQYELIANSLKSIKTEEEITLLIDDFKALFQYYVEISYALIAYDKQQYKEQLDQLECTLYTIRSQIVKRERFRFSKPFPKSQNNLKQQERQMEKISVDKHQSNLEHDSGSLVVENLTDTTYEIKGQLDTLYLYTLTNTIVDMGKVSGAIWVDKCKGCTFKGIMHQLRIHQTQDCTFIVNVSSNPIIEGCTGLKFGKLNEDEHNKWDQVQDFNWLKQEKSPNFTLI